MIHPVLYIKSAIIVTVPGICQFRKKYVFLCTCYIQVIQAFNYNIKFPKANKLWV